jgi:hypothetical protein
MSAAEKIAFNLGVETVAQVLLLASAAVDSAGVASELGKRPLAIRAGTVGVLRDLADGCEQLKI